MKLRRALATAAATAVIGPAALLAAPPAYADDPSTSALSGAAGSTDTSGTTDETTTGGETSGTDSGTTSSSTTSETTDGNTTGDDTGDKDTGSTDTVTTAGGGITSDTTTGDDTNGTTGDTTTGGTTGGGETPSSTWPRACNGEFDRYDKDLDAILTGFPSKIVAGSGFHNFTMNVTNNSDTAHELVYLGVYVASGGPDIWNPDTTDHLTVQFKDPQSGMWKNISLNANWIEEDPDAGYATFTGISPAETVSLDLRISVDAKTPAGHGIADAVAQYLDGEGTCNVDGGKEHYEFEVLAADSSSGKIPSATSKPGTNTPPAQPSGNVTPSGDTETTPEGQLAETGSSSALPTIAVIGGVAMAVGAGAIVGVRRRKTTDSGTADSETAA